MFPIKVRAWLKETKEMIPVYTINFATQVINAGHPWRFFDEIELMQYTWLYDDKGKEIFVGDIVEVHNKSETTTSYLSEVIMTHDGALVHSHPAHRILGLGEWTQLSRYADYGNGDKFDTRCKIVGNIYENPELLEVE